ncbi:hypothetical protein B2G86_12320 [Mammaliicoccus fleurettii]|nr:hypothetical protein B2G86_12320 [Mammaliicoccus fleurettii]
MALILLHNYMDIFVRGAVRDIILRNVRNGATYAPQFGILPLKPNFRLIQKSAVRVTCEPHCFI